MVYNSIDKRQVEWEREVQISDETRGEKERNVEHWVNHCFRRNMKSVYGQIHFEYLAGGGG